MSTRKPAKKKPVKRATKKPAIVSYTKKVQSDRSVKAADNKVKDLEKRLKLAKKAKATAVTAARKRISKSLK